jgi:hypothetical protein
MGPNGKNAIKVEEGATTSYLMMFVALLASSFFKTKNAV